MAAPGFELILILDGPTLPWAEARPSLEAVLSELPEGAILILDRDLAPDRGGPSDLARLARLAALRALTARRGAPLAVSARVDLALACGADGVQLPESGFPAALVRATWPQLWVGRSCHDRAGLEQAAADGARWATLSPVHPPFSKPPSGPPLGIDGFGRTIAGLSLPVFGLGGVDGPSAAALRARGAAGVATMAGVLGRTDAVARARALLAPTRASRPGPG